MKQLSKIVSRQDANFKLSPCSSNETSINLSNEIADFISHESGNISFKIYKEDFIKALGALSNFSQIYHKKETVPTNVVDLFSDLSNQIRAQFNDSITSIYTIYFLRRDDGRFYLNSLKLPNGFNLRSFLVEQYSELIFVKEDDGSLAIRLNTSCDELKPSEELLEKIKEMPKFHEPLVGESLQRIYYGAPGTGKSYKINDMCVQYENYRTTFHPDTDYSSFVGSYKPITKQVPVYTSYGDKALIIKDDKGSDIKEDRIVYRYVFQVFLKAYIAAWREQQNETPAPVFLVVEEINRGNCAQIFGDIFQLLDRNAEGFSDYPIVADDDLAQELSKEFEKLNVANADAINGLYKGGKDVVGMVKDGSHLLLPNNMYIWATMNTSDQSLFPIDSAFKRRWDWEYIKIKEGRDEKNNKLNYKIKFSNGNIYDWWEFVTVINERIEGGEIQQEDKKLGYFFAKAKDGVISAKTLLSKVLFFIYNDVFKDFGFEEDFFKDEEGKTMTFATYFDENGEIDENRVERFLNNLGLTPNPKAQSDAIEGLTINGKKILTVTEAVIEILKEAAQSNSYDDIRNVIDEVFTDRDDVVKSIDNANTYQKENRWNKTPIIANDNTAFVVSNQWRKEYLPQVKELAELFSVPFDFAIDEYEEDDDAATNGKRLKYSVNGSGSFGIGEAFLEMSKVIAQQPGMTLQRMIEAGKTIRNKDIYLPVDSLPLWKEDHAKDSKRDRRFFENSPIITVGDNIEFVVSTQWGKQRLDKIQEFAAIFGMQFEQITQ